MGYDDEAYLQALPSQRLAFSYFTPREKHHLARTLMEARGQEDAAPLPALDVDIAVAARALALEARLLGIMQRYGLRGARR